MSAIANRYEFTLLFDVENGNPNGDPDAGNMPRIDPETNFGLVTDVCLKRKIRNYVLLKHANKAPYRIYVQEKAVLNVYHEEAQKAVGVTGVKEEKKRKGTGDEVEKARQWMCANFYDVRTFGAVMSTGVNCGQVTGPVQVAFARSIDAVTPLEISITRMAVATEAEAEKQSGDNRTMGRKHIIPYGLYRAEGFISAHFAERTGFSDDDLKLFWEALANMFEHDRSAARGKMAARRLVAFKHDSAIGSAPAHKLFELVTVKRATDPANPARAYSDYAVTVNERGTPKGVELMNLL
jgi:CRISPR-associated protein Csd2